MNSGHSSPDICHVLIVVDGESEDVIDVFELELFELQAFAEQFDVPLESDPDMLDRYAVGPDDESFIRDHLPEGMSFDFRRNGYFIEAVERD